MQYRFKRAILFVRSVLPADPAQLVFLFGCMLLFISFQLRWWPAEVTGSIRHIGPNTFYRSDDPVLQSANAWIPFYWWCSVVFLVCGAAGLFVSLWPGSQPLRCVLLFLWLPSIGAFAAICSRWLYLARDPLFPLLNHAFLMRQHNASWAMAAVWQLGPGLHMSLLSLLLLSFFLSRMAFGLTSLPVSWPEPSVQNANELDRWARIWLFVLFACTSVFVVKISCGLPIEGVWLLLNRRPAGITVGIGRRADWIFYLLAPLSLAILAGGSAWAVGKDRWKCLRQFLRVPQTKYLFLAILFPVALRAFVLFFMYARERIVWAAFRLGEMDAPSLGSYFARPGTSTFAEYMPAAFFEEVIWRGYLQPRFLSRYGLYRGLFLVSTMWAAFHFQGDFSSRYTDATVLLGIFSRLANCLALGFVFGWLTLRSNSIWPAAIGHGLYNVRLQAGHTYPILGGTISLILWAALAWFLFRFWPPEPLAETAREGLQLVPDLPV